MASTRAVRPGAPSRPVGTVNSVTAHLSSTDSPLYSTKTFVTGASASLALNALARIYGDSLLIIAQWHVAQSP
ncbi:MAG: hypothetical protein GY889_12425 [Proteobacteria bacterium]|nr:hypothetical protein [Pseudomonadota bacterium]